MKENNLEDFLRENRPPVRENPTFMLEVRNKMDALEGIKGEVERGRKRGRLAIILALALGVAAGAATAAFILILPKIPVPSMPSVASVASADAMPAVVGLLLSNWSYLIYAIAACCAIVLGIMLQGDKRRSRI